MKGILTGTLCVAFVILAVLIGTGSAYAAPTVELEWIGSPSSTNYLTAHSVAVDGEGNVYVMGDRNNPFGAGNFLTKYDAAGSMLWEKPIQSTEHYNDIATDSAGNVYMAMAGSFGTSLCLRKYDADGNVLWTQTDSSSRSYSAAGTTVAVDAYGNPYLAGYSYRDAGDASAVFTSKYDADGNVQWTDIDESVFDSANGIAVDAAGNAYISGNASGNDVLRKYDIDGNVQWTVTGDGLIGSNDVAVTASGDVYAVGENGILKKYDTDGNAQWLRIYGPTGSESLGCGVTLDAAGNAYITGTDSFLGGDRNMFFHIYDYNGTAVTTQTYLRPSQGWDITYYGLSPASTGYYLYIAGSDPNGPALFKYHIVEAAVPEPTTIIMIGAGVIALAASARRRLAGLRK